MSVRTVLEDGTELQSIPCPDCDGTGCDVCESQGYILVLPDSVRTFSATLPIDVPRTEDVEREAKEGGEGNAPEGEKRAHRLTSETAREAARLRWAKERTRQAEAAALAAVPDTGSDLIVRTTIEVSAIIKRLSADAKKGNTQAARELRAWLADVEREQHTQLSDLDERTRQSLLARLLREDEEERALLGTDHDVIEAVTAVEVDEATPPPLS